MPSTKLRYWLPFFTLFTITACTDNQSREAQKPSRDQHTTPPISVPDFSGEEAFDYLRAQTDFGPRNPGSPAHEECLEYLVRELTRVADAVNRQEFMHTGYGGELLKMTNIIASFNLQARNRVLFAAHWDSRPYGDEDKDPKKRDKPILGANDGASGVAVLLQLAKIMKQHPPPIGVDLILFDGEDYGKKNDFTNFLLGSKYFASHKSPTFNPQFGILLDMIGDSELEIPKDKSSLRFAPDVVQFVWATAERLGLREFASYEGPDIYDDHIPLNEVGIKTIDLIDFHYPDASHRYWHTSEDTPDKCSPASLQVVGTLLTHLIYEKSL